MKNLRNQIKTHSTCFREVQTFVCAFASKTLSCTFFGKLRNELFHRLNEEKMDESKKNGSRAKNVAKSSKLSLRL